MNGARRAAVVVLLEALLLGLVGVSCTDRETPQLADEQPMTMGSLELNLIDHRSGTSSELAAVVLLHGASFRARTWQESATLEALSDANIGAVAIDLPGYGESPSTDVASEDVIATLLDELSLERAVIVSPSMSGGFSLPALEKYGDRFAGFVPVAPVGIAEFSGASVESVPSLVVWGESDQLDGQSELVEKLGPSARAVTISDAGHAAYLDQPGEFNRLLVDFVKGL